MGDVNTLLNKVGGELIEFNHDGTSNTPQMHTSDFHGGVNYKTCATNWGVISTSYYGGNLTYTHKVRPFGQYIFE